MALGPEDPGILTAVAPAGFADVTESRYIWPIGPWASDARLKDIGRWNVRNFELGMEGWSIAQFTRHLGVSILAFLLPLCSKLYSGNLAGGSRLAPSGWFC